MRDIELIVKIPEEIRLALINNIPLSKEQWSICDSYIRHAIINGIPLPKGHGRLIDADELLKDRHRAIPVIEVIEAQTIIEADKAESEE